MIANQEIARNFELIAALLSIQGANPFRVRAYREAARFVNSYPESLATQVARESDLTLLPTIGLDLAEKIIELVKTGELKYLSELRHKVGLGLVELLDLEGLGPKRVKELHDKLKIKNKADLKVAAQAGKIAKLEGYGKKLQAQILENLRQSQINAGKYLWAQVEPIVNELVAYLQKCEQVIQVSSAGSFRRGKETVGDLDILVASKHGAKVADYFVNFSQVKRVIAKGATKTTVQLELGIEVDLRVVEPRSFGAAWHYFTGSKDHNIYLRQVAKAKNLKVNE